MPVEEKYIIYTDASFDELTKIGTYAIIVTKENNVMKIIVKKCRIQINNSLECEIFAIYQAINVILSCYTDKNKVQKFRIRTDCTAARDFFIENGNNEKIFQGNVELQTEMKKIYKKLCVKLSKYSSSFKLKWIPREANKVAHKYSYSAFKKLKPTKSTNIANEILMIEKQSFFEILTKITKKESKIILYLFNNVNEQKIILTTQEEIAKSLNISIPTINKCFKQLINLNIIEKVKNGKYAVLI